MEEQLSQYAYVWCMWFCVPVSELRVRLFGMELYLLVTGISFIFILTNKKKVH